MNLSFVGYTYCIKFLPTGQVYYGSRCAKNCNPSEFWVKYFTSSKLVKKLINEYGKDSFVFEIRKTFADDPKKAQHWEKRVLRRINAGSSPMFLNKSNGVAPTLIGWKNPFYGKKHTDESRKIMSEKSKERTSNPTNNPMYGKKHKESTKQKMSVQRKGLTYEDRYGKERAEEIKLKASQKLSGCNNPLFGKKRPEITGLLNPMRDPVIIKKHADRVKNRPKILCTHCGCVMDNGGYTVHKKALTKKGIILP